MKNNMDVNPPSVLTTESEIYVTATYELDMIQGKNITLSMDCYLDGKYPTEEATVVVNLASKCLQYELGERPNIKDLVTTLAPFHTKPDDHCILKNELEAAQTEIQKWHSSFQNEPFIPAGTTPVPKLVINYLQALKSSEESLGDQLEKAKKKEAAFIVTFAKHEQEIAELKYLAERKEQVASWTADKKLVSTYAMSLQQIDNGVVIPPSGWKCSQCDKTDNLWLN